MSTAIPSPLDRIRPDVRAMHAYAVQDATGLVKLDTMENPYRLSAELQRELGQRLGAIAINRYPGADAERVKAALIDYSQPPKSWGVMLGNGSDELISLLALVCAQPGASIMAPLPSFVFYALCAQLQGLAFHGVPLQSDFQLDEATMLAAIAQHKPSLLYLANPNNPTGTQWDADVMERLIAAQGAHGGIAVIDEAYQPFAETSWIDRIRANPDAHAHVLLMRTLSKFGLAGVRLGYLLGHAELIHQIDKARPPFNVSVLNAECALFALEHTEVFAAQALQIKFERQRVFNALGEMHGVTPYPSQGNMILARVPDAAHAFQFMKDKGVLIKNVSAMHPMLANCLRLTIGTPEENTLMLAALQAALRQN